MAFLFICLAYIIVNAAKWNCQRKTVKLDLFEPYRWGSEVMVNKMKPVKHIFNEMPISNKISGKSIRQTVRYSADKKGG